MGAYTAQAAIGNSRLLKFAVGANVDSNFDATVHLKPCGGTVCYAVFLRAAPSFIFDNVATFIREEHQQGQAFSEKITLQKKQNFAKNDQL